MSTRTGIGTTPTILVTVVTIGDGGLCAAELGAAPCLRPARAPRAGVTRSIPATGATVLSDGAADAARRAATWPWA
jgi:hypothetical protein